MPSKADEEARHRADEWTNETNSGWQPT
jgi:hypothetical protein